MGIIRNEEGKWVSSTEDFTKKVLSFGKDVFQGIARETLSTSVEISKQLKKVDDRLTGGFFNFPERVEFEDENSSIGKLQRNIFFGTPNDMNYIGGYEEEGKWIADILKEGYKLDDESAKNLGTGTTALFALTNFIPGKNALIKEFVKETSPEVISKSLIKNGVPERIAIEYSPFVAKATKESEVKNILSQLDNILKETKEIVPESGMARSAADNGIIEMPTLTKRGDISIQTTKQSAKDVQHLINLKNKANKIRTNVLLQEKEKILKSQFKSVLQKEQDVFTQKLRDTIIKFKEHADDIQSIKNDLFQIAKNHIPDEKISKALVKKIVEASTPSSIRKTILSISKEKDKIVRKQLINSIKEVVKNSDDFTILQKEKMAATIDKVRMSGMTKETEEKIVRMREYFHKNPERELVLGRKNSKILSRAEDLSRRDLKDLNFHELRELERRLSYIKDMDSLEKKTRKETRKLQTEIAVDILSKDAVNLDIKGKIDSIGKELTDKEKVNNFWVSFKEAFNGGYLKYLSADNFFGQLGDNFKRTFKESIDEVANLAKDRYSRKAIELLGKEAELFKKYGEKLAKPNYERIMIYAVRVQKGGKDKLIASGLTEKFIDDIKLTAQEMEWYNYSRKELDLIFPKIDEVLIDTSNGQMRLGKTQNYFPMNIDFNKSEELAKTLFNDTYFKTRGVSKGFTKHRNVFGKEVLRLDARDVYLGYMKKANNFIEMEKTIRHLQEVASAKKLKESIGKEASSYIDEWLDTISRDGVSKNYQRKWFEDLRDNIGTGFLGFKISTILKQPLAKITSGALLGPKHTFAHDVEFVSNRLWQIVDDVSLQQKYRAFDDPSYDVTKLNKWQRWGYSAIKEADKMTANSVWYSSYKKYFDDKNLNFSLDDFRSKKINEDAAKYADEVVRKTQGSSEIKDLPQMLRGDNRALWKTLFQFQSFILNQSQLLTVDMKNAILKEKDPVKAFNILTFFVLTGLGESYISSGLTNVFGSETAKKKEEEMEFGERIADSFFGQIPLINNAISVSKFGGSGIPLIDTGGDIVTGIDSLFTSEKDKTKAKGALSAATGAASLFGVAGAKQLEQFIKAGINSMDEETTPHDSLKLELPTKKSNKKIQRAIY